MIAAVSTPPPPSDGGAQRSTSAPRVGRRTALGVIGAGALIGVSACESPGGTPVDTPGARRTIPSRDTDPDVALAAQTLAALEVARGRLAQVQAALPGLRAPLRPARALVEAHLDLVREAVPDPPTVPSPTATAPPADAAAGRRMVRGELRRLPALMVEQSVRADSGAFAQLLAQMGAAYAQADYVFGGGR